MKEPLDIKNQICFPVYSLAKEIVNQYRPLLEELDITYPQYLVLMVLWKEKEQTVGQLGEKLFLDSGTLTPLLKRMEGKNMVVRTRSSADERVVKLSLTEKGIALKEQAKDIPHRLVKAMGISKDELLELKNIITKILNKEK
mgnify:CR=1 FL=1|jgi:MarR family transcriptional regulator, organic hydroperoxide resistance regulator|nr:MarR family transcriptional regulator [uncultured Flavobacterium sp.]